MRTANALNITKTTPESEAQLCAWAKAPMRTGEELAFVAGKFARVDRIVGSHPNATPQVLEDLSHSSDKLTRARVAAHVNTPLATYVKLGPQFPKAFLENPALDLLLLENPALLEDFSPTLLATLLKSTSCPPVFLTWAAGLDDEQIQLAVAMNPGLPEAGLNRLKCSRHARVREAIQSYEYFSASTFVDPETAYRDSVKSRLQELCPTDASEAWAKKDIGIAQYPYLSAAARLTVSGVDWISAEAYSALPASILEALSKDSSPGMRSIVAINRNATAAMLCRICENEEDGWVTWWIKADAAGNPCAPDHLLETLAQHPEESVRYAVAKNPNAPVSALNLLVDDSSAQVSAIARNSLSHRSHGSDSAPETAGDPPETSSTADIEPDSITADYLQQALDPINGVEMRERLAKSPATPAFILGLLAEDDAPTVIEAVATNPNTPLDALDGLCRRPSARLASMLLANPSMPKQLIDQLLAKTNKKILMQALREADLKALERFARNCNDHKILAKLITHPNASASSVEELCERLGNPMGGTWYQSQLVRAPLTAQEAVKQGNTLYFSGKDPNRTVLCRRPVAALMSLSCGAHLETKRIIRVAGSTDWLVRAAVARNSGTPPNILKKLASDAHPLVRALANSNIAKPQGPRLKPGAEEGKNHGGTAPLTNPHNAAAQPGEQECNHPSGAALLAPCPNCGGIVRMPAVGAALATRHGGALRSGENQHIDCTGASGQDKGCGFAVRYSPAGRTFDRAEAEQLLLERRVGPLTGFRSKAWLFTAEIGLIFDEDLSNYRLEFSFGDDRNSDKMSELEAFGSQHSLGVCPKCGSAVFEHGSNYVCEKSVPTVAQASPSCDFKIGQIILQQQIVRKQMHKLLATGKTDLLDQFVSNRTRKAFRAMLIWDAAAEKVTFDFGENVSAQTQEKLTDLKLSQNLGICPKCGGGIYEHIKSYVCEKSFCTPLQPNPSCDLRFDKSISQRPISAKEITKLLKTGRTNLLGGFVSENTQRKFKATLVWDRQHGRLEIEREQQRALDNGFQRWLDELSGKAS